MSEQTQKQTVSFVIERLLDSSKSDCVSDAAFEAKKLAYNMYAQEEENPKKRRIWLQVLRGIDRAVI